MVDFDEQLRSYSLWLAEQADRQTGERGRPQAVQVDPHSPVHRNRRRWWPIAAVAAVSALVLGLLAIAETRDAQAPVDQPLLPTTSPTRTTTVAVTTSPAPAPDDALVPRAVDEAMVRPLADLADGDVVVPTYVPDGMVFDGPARNSDDEFSFSLHTPDRGPYTLVRQWPGNLMGGPDVVQPTPPDPATLTDPDHPPIEIAGITWGWFDFEQARTAHVGRSVIIVGVNGLDEVEAERFIEGLRAASIEQFPGPIWTIGG
jgi:hypothetical protein